MTDRELLELAAKAAGVSLRLDILRDESREWEGWNPLTDDGDALRLAVKLGMTMELAGEFMYALGHAGIDAGLEQVTGDDPYAATRRAIVRAAAEIGKTMP